MVINYEVLILDGYSRIYTPRSQYLGTCSLTRTRFLFSCHSFVYMFAFLLSCHSLTCMFAHPLSCRSFTCMFAHLLSCRSFTCMFAHPLSCRSFTCMFAYPLSCRLSVFLTVPLSLCSLSSKNQTP